MQSGGFSKGWHQIGNGQFAYLQPSGTWGYSNAGLVTDGGEAMLVDTLFDERLTAEMLAGVRDVSGVAADAIGTLVNTHANGDHTYGNRLVAHAKVIASAAAAHEMTAEDAPEYLASIMTQTGELGDLGLFLEAIFGAFDIAGVRQRLPDETFSGTKTLKVGDKDVQLIEVGPAHTAGDTLVLVPTDRTVYTGDILFIDGTPIMWSGPVGNWLAACDRILAMDVETIVPGHGPLTDKAGVRQMRSYLSFLDTETRARHATGMSSWDIAQDISLAEFGRWNDAERVAVTVDTIVRELEGETAPRNIAELFTRMTALDKKIHPERYAKPPAGSCGLHTH